MQWRSLQLISLCWLATSLLPGPAAASAIPGQTCAITGSGAMRCSVADCELTGTLTADCDGAGDDAGGDDLLDIRGEVACSGDVLQDGTVPASGITVAEGAVFACDAAALGSAGVEVRLGPAGLIVGDEAAWTVQDRWLRPTSPVVLETEPQWTVVADVIPCPVVALSGAVADGTSSGPYEPDCANGQPNEVMLAFDGPSIDGLLSAVVPGRTLWCWGEPDPSKPVADTTSCYEVARVNALDRFVTIDVHQGIAGTRYDWDQREIAEYALATELTAGARAIEVEAVQGGSAFPVDYFHNARWVGLQSTTAGDDVCGDADADPCRMDPIGQLALELTYDASSWAASGGRDTLYVADPRGARQSHPAGTRLWITYGHRPGETGSFRAPVRLTSATATTVDHGDSVVVLDPGAEVDLEGGLLDGLAMDTLLSDDARLRWTWIRDPAGLHSGGCTTGHVLRLSGSEGVELIRVSKTGGHAGAGADCDRLHGIACVGHAGLRCEDFTIRDLRWRHTGDDTVTAPGSGGPTVEGYEFRRVISEFASNASESAEMFQVGAWGEGSLVNVYCGDCLSKSSAGGGVLTSAGASTTVRNVMAMGIHGGLGDFESPTVRNLSLYGGDAYQRAGQGFFLGSVSGFVIDHYLAPFSAVTSEVGVVRGVLENGLVRRSQGRAKAAIRIESGAVLRNVLVHETRGGGASEADDPCEPGDHDPACVLFDVGTNASDTRIERVTAIGSSGQCGILSLKENTPPNRVDALLATDMSETGASCRSLQGSEIAVAEAAEGSDPWCFHGSLSSNPSPDVVAAALDDLPPGSLSGVDPAWLDPASGGYLPDPASPVGLAGCGARGGAGVAELTWAHRLRRIGRDCLDCPHDDFPTACGNGLDDDGDGAVDFPEDVGCQDLFSTTEAPVCADGKDNDGDGRFDWDGAGQGAPDPGCAAIPWRSTELSSSCGLGPSLLPLLLALQRLHHPNRLRSRRRPPWRGSGCAGPRG